MGSWLEFRTQPQAVLCSVGFRPTLSAPIAPLGSAASRSRSDPCTSGLAISAGPSPPCLRLASPGSAKTTTRPTETKPRAAPQQDPNSSPALSRQHLEALGAPLIRCPFNPNQSHPVDVPLNALPAPPSRGHHRAFPAPHAPRLCPDSSPLSSQTRMAALRSSSQPHPGSLHQESELQTDKQGASGCKPPSREAIKTQGPGSWKDCQDDTVSQDRGDGSPTRPTALWLPDEGHRLAWPQSLLHGGSHCSHAPTLPRPPLLPDVSVLPTATELASFTHVHPRPGSGLPGKLAGRWIPPARPGTRALPPARSQPDAGLDAREQSQGWAPA